MKDFALIPKKYNNWSLVRRNNKIYEEPKVTIRKAGISFNASLVKLLDKNLKYCEFYINDKTIGIKFLTHKTHDSYTITHDGGGKSRKTNSLIANCKQIITSNLALMEASKIKQSFTCLSTENCFWEFNITPLYVSTDVSLLKQEDIGVYKYFSEGDLVYIGQGFIKQRLNDNARDNWFFDKIEYFLCSKEEAMQYEENLINEHIKRYGKLPLYNRQKAVNNV